MNYDIWAESEKAKIDLLKAKWSYYVDEAEQAPDVDTELRIFSHNKYADGSKLPFVDTTFFDPCMGSGHVLVYAFDVFMDIYTSQGWNPRDAAQRIVEKNLYGLDIDARAAQLAYFAVMMKARQYDRRFFTRGIQPNLYSPGSYPDGQEYGSLLVGDELEPKPEAPEEFTLFDANYEEQLNAWNFRRLLSQEYDVVVTNPPYMAVSNGNAALNKYIKKNYPDSKGDLFAAFIERCWKYCSQYLAMITQHSWMFLSSFEKLRTKLLLSTDIVSMAHLGARAFEEIGGEVVQTTSFVLRMGYHEGYRGTYCRLVDPTTQQGKEDMFLFGKSRHIAEQTNFFKIPGSPIAYWWRNFKLFDFSEIKHYYESAGRNKTHNNELYTRNWWEISDTEKWQPYANGGEFRRWAGNDYEVVDWSDEAKEFYTAHGGLYNQKFCGKQGICWNLITSYKNGFRLKNACSHYSSGSPTIIAVSRELDYWVLAFLNSVVATTLLAIYNPTLNTTVGDVLGLPLSVSKDDEPNIVALSTDCVSISQKDWDSYETSSDFKRHPLV